MALTLALLLLLLPTMMTMTLTTTTKTTMVAMATGDGEAWFHTDQNAATRPGLQTVQSFVSLYDQPADGSRGNLLVVPRSHHAHDETSARAADARRGRPLPPDAQFVMLPANDPALFDQTQQRRPPPPGGGAPPPPPPPLTLRRVACRAGDLVRADATRALCLYMCRRIRCAPRRRRVCGDVLRTLLVILFHTRCLLRLSTSHRHPRTGNNSPRRRP